MVKMSNELNFYEIGAYGYEECIEKQYYSYGSYSQNEFEDMVFKVMKRLMYNIIEDEPTSLCYYNIYFNPDDLILNDDFDKLMSEEGFFRLGDRLSARVGFELDGRYENEWNNRLDNEFRDLEIDESCIDNDCSRIKNETVEDKEYCKKKCGVTIRRCLI